MGRLVRELAGVLLPALLATALFLLVPRDSRSQGEGGRNSGRSEDAELCGGWHRGSGETVPLDLARVKRAYRELQARLSQSLDAREGEPRVDLEQPYDAGLPGCREAADRTVALAPEKLARVRGRTFYFAAVADPARFELPREFAKDPSAKILVVRARKLGDLAELARSLGRPVSLGSSEFAKALGVRCASTLVKIPEKGDEILLHEAR